MKFSIEQGVAVDPDRVEELDRSVREYLGWKEILAKEDDLNLTTNQRNQATERQAKASETTDARGGRPAATRPSITASRPSEGTPRNT